MLTPRRVPSGRFTFFTSTTSVVSKLPLVTLASARARPSGTTPPMAGPDRRASVVVPPACARPDPVVTSTLAMARPMRTLDHVAFMTSRFLPHASCYAPISREDQPLHIEQSPSRSRAGCRHSSLPGRDEPPGGKPQAGCDDSSGPVVTVSCSPTGADKPARPPTLERLLPAGTDDTRAALDACDVGASWNQIESAHPILCRMHFDHPV